MASASGSAAARDTGLSLAKSVGDSVAAAWRATIGAAYANDLRLAARSQLDRRSYGGFY